MFYTPIAADASTTARPVGWEDRFIHSLESQWWRGKAGVTGGVGGGCTGRLVVGVVGCAGAAHPRVSQDRLQRRPI